jgi:hypothetical protein
MSLAAAVLDYYDDSQHELMAKVAMPASVRGVQMTELTPDQMASLPDSEFGLVILTKRASVLRKFPVNDPGNAWLSAQFFHQTHEKLAFPARFIAAKFIKTACDAYGVPSSPRVDAYAVRADDEITSNTFVEGSETRWMLRKLAQREFIEKQAEAAEVDALTAMPDKNFALVMRTGDGAIVRKYAMPDDAHVKLAAEYFAEYAMQLPAEHRHSFAANVKARAEELGVDVSDHEALHKWASTGWNQHVIAHIEQRKSLLPRNESARSVLDKLAASLGETTPADAAHALQTFDQATGLNRYYDRGLADPFASTMGSVGDTEKKASAWSDDVDGHTITEADLRKLPEAKLASYLGQSFVQQFSDHPVEVYESLPADAKTLIKQMISGEA